MVIKLFKNSWAKIQKQSIVNQFQFTNNGHRKKKNDANWDGMACARNNNEMINSNKIARKPQHAPNAETEFIINAKICISCVVREMVLANPSLVHRLCGGF